jgi:hypothetical protein
LDIQITLWEEEKMGLTLESVKEFHTAECSLLLGDVELSLLKSEVEVEAPPSKSKKRGLHALDAVHISPTPTKKKKGRPGSTDVPVSPAKRKAAQEGAAISTAPTKKAKVL